MSAKSERILHIALLLLLVSPPPAESAIVAAIKTAVTFAYQAYNIINDAHDTYRKFAPQTTLDDVLNQAKRVEEQVDQIGAQLSNQISRAVDTIVTRTDDLNNIREGRGKLGTGIRRIDNMYRLFELFTEKRIRLNNHTLQDFIQQATTIGAFSPKDILNEIYELIIPSSGFQESFLYYISKNLPENDTYSCRSSSPQGHLYQIFRLVMVNEIRAFTMMAFAYSMNQVFKCESFEGEIDYAQYQLQSRARDYYEVFSELAAQSANSIRSCDPRDGWLKGETFYEFDRWTSTYFISARALWPSSDSCKAGCRKGEKLSLETCDPEYGCFEETSCHGTIYLCVTTWSPVTVCELEPAGKRYQYFNAGKDGRLRGNNSGGCQGDEIVLKKQNDCALCWCICVEDSYKSHTLRTFSAREQLSDVANNKVVTGVKFVVMENMTHIQIQQGEVLPEGRIVPSSVAWKPLENIKFDAERTKKELQYVYYIDSDDGTKYDMEEITDYVSFTWDRYRIHIDDLIVPPRYVVTGVKFTPYSDDRKEQPIQIGIQASPYEYDSGKISITDDNPSIWLTAADMVGQIPEYDEERLSYKTITSDPLALWGYSGNIGESFKSKFPVESPLNPLTHTGKAIPRSSPNQYVIAESSDIRTDAGQTTLPFLDAQEVIGKPPFAAGGIGLYYKSTSDDIGGFVGLRLFALDAMKNIQIDVLDKLDEFKKDVTEFKGCNDEI